MTATDLLAFALIKIKNNDNNIPVVVNLEEINGIKEWTVKNLEIKDDKLVINLTEDGQ